MYKIIDGNKACANSSYLFTEMAAIYPITPSSPMASQFDNLACNKKKNMFGYPVKLVEMQSEAGVAGAIHGSLLTGSLSTTFTSSQGLLLMIPNLYKMAGECLPAVIHVASRSIATHALSILGDHSDIYATRATGCCILASSSVEDASNLSIVSHLSAIKGCLPFIHFFDGFRTSHEINKINTIEEEDILKLIDYDAILEFKNRMLIKNKVQKGMTENEDIYFQTLEARNTLYNDMPSIVDNYMSLINKLTNKKYKPFNFYGNKEAKNIIVAMGSVNNTIKLVVDDLNKRGKKVGLVEVHLYRPFSKEYLLKAIPKTVKNIAVLDRSKEAGSVGEPLYLDVCSCLKNMDINVVGGRYGISSKNTTPSSIVAVFDMLDGKLKDNFTIGIKDDVTNLSLDEVDYHLDLNCEEIKIYGYASDGMVSASKDIANIVGENKFVQSYSQYDSKKSTGVTISNIRISDDVINAPYYCENVDMVVVAKEEYFYKLDMLKNLKDKGILLINTSKNLEEFLPNRVKKYIKEHFIKVYTIDANLIASRNNLNNKISRIIEVCILKILSYFDEEKIIKSIKKSFMNKGNDVVNANINSIKDALNYLKEDNTKLTYDKKMVKIDDNIFNIINKMEGNSLPVSSLLKYKDGSFPNNIIISEKKSNKVPVWKSENCIQCGQCAFVCPHAVIRPIIGKTGIPFSKDSKEKYEIVVSENDCTACGLCIDVCPGKNGNKALVFNDYDLKRAKYAHEAFKKSNPNMNLPTFSVKGCQFIKPRFAFSGACRGCGETPYIKLLTQLFSDSLIIANATGCSSIYGGSVPNMPYSIPWANSLFEDNAEFAYGMYMSIKYKRDNLTNIMMSYKDDKKLKDLSRSWLENKDDFNITNDIKNKLSSMKIEDNLKDLLEYVPAKKVWAIGGDGWAYDIGFSGIDHILSSNEKIRILVLDTELYSNTGGQISKSSHLGSVGEFANNGKKTKKKDLFKIAMNYPNCYVASICLGANFNQTLKAFKEADENNGPSIIIAYSTCVEHGINGGMTSSIEEQKKAVECGYITLMRFKDGVLSIDSKEPDFTKYEDFLTRELRYKSLLIKDQEKAKKIFKEQMESSKKRYLEYKKISEQ